MKKLFSMFLAAAALVLATGCTQIDSGNVGVSVTRGKISLEEKPQGNYFTPIETLNEFTTKEVSFQLTDLKPKSSDNLTMADLDVDIYFQANPGQVADTVLKYQGDVVKHRDVVAGSKSDDLVAGFNKVSREAREAVYVAAGQFPATTMHTKRIELAEAVKKQLQSELDKSDPKTWTITGVNIRNLVTDPGIEKAIRMAVEKDQQIEAAKKEKQLAIELGNAKIETAKAEARSNEILSASLTPQLVRLKEIEAQRAFAGQGTHTVVMGQPSGALVSIGK